MPKDINTPSLYSRLLGPRESLIDGRYCFDVRAALGGHLIVHYQGWLVDHE